MKTVDLRSKRLRAGVSPPAATAGCFRASSERSPGLEGGSSGRIQERMGEEVPGRRNAAYVRADEPPVYAPVGEGSPDSIRTPAKSAAISGDGGDASFAQTSVCAERRGASGSPSRSG